MPAFFATGAAADVVLVLMLLEAAALLTLLRGRGAALVPLVANLVSGACMVLALRAALVQADWTTIAAFLLGSFAAHGVELALRLRPLANPSASPRRTQTG
jgi:hypothetical protein